MEHQETFLSEVQKLSQLEPRFAKVVDECGMPSLRLRPKGPEALIRIICEQQLSKSSAHAISTRVLQAWPSLSQENIINNPLECLAGLGLSRAKMLSLSDFVQKLASGEVVLQGLEKRPVEEAMAHLMQVRGIGPWSAQLYLMFSLNHPDIFAPGDLALQRGHDRLFELSVPSDEKTLGLLSEKWRPHRSAAAHLLWHYYSSVVRPSKS